MQSLFHHNLGLFVLFNILVLGMLAIDLGVFNRKAHQVKMREAVTWSLIWIGVSLLFAFVIWESHGSEDALLYLTGYIIEKSLSVDNIFVFLIIFLYFDVPSENQHKVLFWGIIGALIMRGVLIAAGISLITRFQWLIYVLGFFLIVTGVKAATSKNEHIDVAKNPLLKFMRKYLRVTDNYEDSRFFVRKEGVLFVTPLFIVLALIETTDVIFALDSIPAILAISQDPFIVYTSNVFAILGLRALYFVVADMLSLFRYLRFGVCIVLVFVGGKMMLAKWWHMPPKYALAVVGTILGTSLIASIVTMRKPIEKPDSGPTPNER